MLWSFQTMLDDYSDAATQVRRNLKVKLTLEQATRAQRGVDM